VDPFDNPTLAIPPPDPSDAPDGPLETVAGTELTLPAPSNGTLSFVKGRIAAYLHLTLKPTDIQALLGLSLPAYTALLKDPDVQAEQRRLAAEELHRAAFVKLRLAGEAEKSLERLIQLRDHAREERTQLAAAESILDREGTLHKKIQPTTQAALLVVSDDQIKAGLRAALESLAPGTQSALPAIVEGGAVSVGETS
jgi:hypothetical protein